MTQTLLDFDSPRFPGPNLTPSDHARLAGQMQAIFALMRDGEWRTLQAISEATGAPQASVSAQLRHLRKRKWGSHTVERNHCGHGLYTYRLIVNSNSPTP